MEDDHVDRPDVEAQQCVKLTGTNRSIDLIALIYQRPSKSSRIGSSENRYALFGRMRQGPDGKTWRKAPICFNLCFAGLVAFGEAIRPDPIPNSAVKRFRANGTMSQDLGE